MHAYLSDLILIASCTPTAGSRSDHRRPQLWSLLLHQVYRRVLCQLAIQQRDCSTSDVTLYTSIGSRQCNVPVLDSVLTYYYHAHVLLPHTIFIYYTTRISTAHYTPVSRGINTSRATTGEFEMSRSRRPSRPSRPTRRARRTSSRLTRLITTSWNNHRSECARWLHHRWRHYRCLTRKLHRYSSD